MACISLFAWRKIRFGSNILVCLEYNQVLLEYPDISGVHLELFVYLYLPGVKSGLIRISWSTWGDPGIV